uniref:Uncharacterized protein n=1 Tax=uncultured Chloroflexota bacterium TaxID=166587 RepID=H5SDZ4_9CHLR|nr:hypothetical protein HGMM_F14G08C30 [uncultured Chloroflexota bacterium]
MLLRRVAIAFLIGFAMAALTTEAAYLLQRRENREAQRIELVIPAGTAERVSRGEKPPQIPTEMNFVLGDILVIVNRDSVPHQLGTLWVPPGNSASMILGNVESLALECSFQPTRVFGIEVREPVTWQTRLMGALFAGIPLGALFAVYSVVVGKSRS